jgi:hypothetical protein
MHGSWCINSRDYVSEVGRYSDEIGLMAWAAPQDWMCEPFVTGKTGLTVEEHQRRTIANYLELRALAPDLPFIPVVQGWQVWSYWRCVEMYADAGVDLAALPLVGVGTVCRRQAMASAAGIIGSLATEYRLKLHGFGLKRQGLRQCGQHLVSADSMAWSYTARRERPLPGHTHKNCANCLEYALLWRDQLPDEWIGQGLRVQEAA